MKYILPLALLFVVFACKKDKKDVDHQPVLGLQEISSMSQFNTEISQGVSLMFFHASWCEACHEQRPAVTEVAMDTACSSVFFGEVEFDDYPDIISAHNVTVLPTIIFFKDGAEVDRFSGHGNSVASIKMELQEHI